MSCEPITHLPSCHIEPFRVLPFPAAQAAFLRMASPMPIGLWFTTPKILFDQTGIKQLQLLGTAVFAVLTKHFPRFHRSLVQGQLVEATGTSISVTGITSDDEGIVFATWDNGEDISAPIARMAEQRRLLKLPHEVATAYLRPLAPNLPPPQVCITSVINTPIDCPMTNLGIYDSGPSIPIVLCVGRHCTHLCMDHRLYNPRQEAMFMETFVRFLNV